MNTKLLTVIFFVSFLLTLQANDRSNVPTWEQLSNATYHGLFGVSEPITLVKGKWKGAPYPGSEIGPEAYLVEGFLLTGDLDQDANDEAVVLLNFLSGGSEQLYHLAVVKLQNGKPVNLATRNIGDRIQIRGGRIERGRILLDVVQAATTDPMCCPGDVTTNGYKLDAIGTLNPIALETRERKRLTLDTIANVEWVLKSFDGKSPVPASPRVTLKYLDGKFTGKGGCNSYFVSAKVGEQPGDMILGAVGSTKMTCPESMMSVESRFFQLLSHVKRFEFSVGKLVLTYQTEDGYGTMLFETHDPRFGLK